MSKKKAQARPYVSSITSNLKSPRPCGDDWSIDIGQYTLLVGANTSHKSAVIQSVELGLSGAADDVVGRHNVKDSDLLLSMAPGDELGVTLRLTDDSIGSFNVKREGGKVKRPSHTGPGGETLTHRVVKDALSGSTATKRKAFLTWAAADVTLDDVLAHLPAEMHAKYRDLAEHLGRDKDATQTLLAVAEYAGRRSRELSKERKGAESVIEEIGNQILIEPSDEDIEALRAAVQEAQVTLEEAAAAQHGLDSVELEDAKVKTQQAVGDWADVLADKQAILEAVQAAVPQAPGNMMPSLEVLNWATGQGIDSCPICSSAVGTSHIEVCRDFYDKMRIEWETSSAMATAKLDSLRDEVSDLEQVVAQWQAEATRLSAIIPVATSGISLADARDRLTALQASLSTSEIAASQWAQVVTARERVSAIELEASRYKETQKACEICIGALLNTQAESFSKRVQAYLPGDWNFGVTLYANGKETFQMGIQRDGELHAALSGAEWAALTTAVSMAVSETLLPSQPTVLIPEDRAWDGKTLASVMRGYNKFNGQVLMASTVRPIGRAPKGWTIINMDEVTASWLGEEDGLSSEEGEVVEMPEPVKSQVKTKLRKKADAPIKRAETGLIVTTRSALVLQGMGYSSEDTDKMSKETAAALITQGIAPGTVTIKGDGSYAELKAGRVFNLPPVPTGS